MSTKTKSQQWWKTPLLLLICMIVFGSGCVSGRRVVLVDPEHTILRAGPNMKGRVYIKNAQGEWELSRNPVTISEGWYIGKLD
jgi:hypothetical protein